MEFNDFLNRYEKEALQVDLRTEYPLVFDVLELQKMKLNSVNFDSEIDEVIAFCKKTVNDMKVRLNLVILNEGYITNYANGKPTFYSEIKTYFEYLQLYNKAIDKKQQFPPQQNNIKNTDEINTHPKHNPNDWNNDCFELFKYLFDEYYNDKKRTNTKLICIWFYLSEYNPEKYNLKITKDNYKIFIKKNYRIIITNTDKPDNYESKVLDTLHEHRQNFESNLK